uniref:Peptidase A1 domain-containing protein n=1 Tax=Angiostrongylus costaricensis TaxID=334426 RepID=A0A158PKP2_ANGCS
MEQVWQLLFTNELCIFPSQHPMLVTKPPLNLKGNREWIAEPIVAFNTPNLYAEIQNVLSLSASGRMTENVIDFGDGITHTVSTYEQTSSTTSVFRGGSDHVVFKSGDSDDMEVSVCD